MSLPLIENLRRFVLHREPSDDEFTQMCANTEADPFNITVNDQELVQYEARMFTTAIEFTGDTATAVGQRQMSRERAVRDMALLIYGPIADDLRKLRRDIIRGKVGGRYEIVEQIETLISACEGR